MWQVALYDFCGCCMHNIFANCLFYKLHPPHATLAMVQKSTGFNCVADKKTKKSAKKNDSVAQINMHSQEQVNCHKKKKINKQWLTDTL